MLTAAVVVAVNITGYVKDKTGEPLIEAAVKLVKEKDSAFVAGTTAGLDGKFTLKGVKAGKYVLETSYVGYSTVKTPVTVAKSAVDLGTIELNEASNVLKEVSVVAVKTPIKVKEDTVEYNADSYRTQPNAVVEDLLKRLPGVEVDSDGKITANGKSVSKILIDGKEFFADDPKVASKNLPVSMVDKLQVVDRKSDMARLTGVDDGEDETVINLTVKKGMNNGWFGVAEAGYGTDDRYMGSFNVNRFWNGNQITFLGNFNNINQLGFTDSNGNRFRRFGGDNGITESQSLGVNFNIGKEEILRVGGDLMYSHTTSTTRQRTERQYLFTDSTSYSSIGKRSQDKGHNIRGDFRVLWKPDSFNTLEFRPNFSVNINDSYSTDSTRIFAGDSRRTPVSNSFNDGNSHGNSFEFGGRLIYSHNFKNHRGRSFSLSANYRLSNVREKENSFSRNIFYLFNDSTDLYDQYADNHTWSNSIMARATWTEPLGDVKNGNFLVFSYRMNYRWNNADKLVYDHPILYPDGTSVPVIDYETLVFNDTLSNRFRNDFFNQDIRLGYRHTSKSANIEAGLSLVPSMSKSKDLINSKRNIDTRWVLNVAPYLRYRLKFSKSRSLHLNYFGRSSQPSMSQLQPVADVSDPMHITVGNPDLDPSFRHAVNIRYQDFNSEAQRSVMLMGDFSMTQNSIISRTDFNSETGGQVTTYTNVNGVWDGRLMNMISFPFRNKKWSFSNHIFTMANRTVGFNNSLRNASLSVMINESPGLTFRPDHFELEIRPQYSLQLVKNTLQTSSDRTVHRYGGRFDGTYYTPWGLTLQTDVNYSATSGYSAGYDQKQWMWNASVSYQFLRDRSATVSVKVYDLLQQRQNIRRNITANYIDDTEYNSLTRYFMVTLSYRFNTFGKGNQPADRNERGRFGGPMGPPPGGGRGPR